jgi:hypothetical protein
MVPQRLAENGTLDVLSESLALMLDLIDGFAQQSDQAPT